MIFTMHHDIYSVEIEDVTDENGDVHQMEVEKLLEEGAETEIYVELKTIDTILPYFTKAGEHVKNLSVIKSNGDNYIVKGTLREIVNLKNAKTNIGFKK